MGIFMIELLKEYNPHWNGRQEKLELVPRPDYIQSIKALLERRELLVITGIRRAGKSCLLQLLMRELLGTGIPGKNICYLNLEDYRLGAEKDLGLLETIFRLYQEQLQPRGKIFFLLDEVQEVPGFEKWLRTIYDSKPEIKFIITGSSSTLTSSELATLLTGRQLSLAVYPFSFLEALRYYNLELANRLASASFHSLSLVSDAHDIEPLLQNYLKFGGFPEIVKNANHPTNIMLLQQYLDDILLKDIGRRYNIRKISALQKLAAYLISNIGNEFNIKRTAALLGINRSTIIDLLTYLGEVYLIQLISNFSFSINERLNTTRIKKVYCIDNGLFTATKQTQSPDRGKRMENLVYQQLKFQWSENPFYWKGKMEIDFVLEHGFPVNVTAEDRLREREITGLLFFLNQFNRSHGLLISWNKLETIQDGDRTIVVIPLWLFLIKTKEQILGLFQS
jgi:uncharacterized protein